MASAMVITPIGTVCQLVRHAAVARQYNSP